jgi:hypothetical protein
MWAVENKTPFKADRAFARDRDGAEVWLVAVRGTFTIGSGGEVKPAEEQLEVCIAPKHFGEPAESSLRYEMDLLRTKPGTDIILNATAHAPRGGQAQSLEVGFSLGPVSKKLLVFGDRTWERTPTGLAPTNPQSFTRKPIRYEFAWGGSLPDGKGRHAANPVGIGADAQPGKPVPSIETLESPINSPKDNAAPAGFGAIACHWQPRVKFAGTYDDAWQKQRKPLLPQDFDDAHYRCAPRDQQMNGFVIGGEEVTLTNLTPESLLNFKIPRISLGFSTHISGGVTHHSGRIHTVIIEPDDHRLILVWQTALPCHHSLYTLKKTVVFEKERLDHSAPANVEMAMAK